MRLKASGGLVGKISSQLLSTSLQSNPSFTSFFVASVAATTLPIRAQCTAPLDRLAWSLLLPSSLVLGIWSQPAESSAENVAGMSSNMQVLLAFLFGSIGTFIGSMCGFMLTNKFLQILAKVMGEEPRWRKPDVELVTACTASSYIGGTANFFETGNILKKQIGGTSSSSRMLNIVAGIDILVMITYFAWLMSMRKSDQVGEETTSAGVPAGAPLEATTVVPSDWPASTAPESLAPQALCIAGALTIAKASALIQEKISIPGVSITISTMMALGVQKIRKTWTPIASERALAQEMSKGSELLLCLFYAIIGLNAPFGDILSVGAAPIILLLSTLLTHFGVMRLLTKVWNRSRSKREGGSLPPGPLGKIDLDALIIAR
jgi:uncharacterized membrane protein